MADQIEMSSAENPPVNVFGKPLIMKSSFSFSCEQTRGSRSPNCSWTPFNMGMAKYTQRADSFDYWPKQIVQKPDQMLQSGFYYTGRGDVVTCFFCGITLKHWGCTDDVDSEHKRHSPDCKFMLMCRQN